MTDRQNRHVQQLHDRIETLERRNAELEKQLRAAQQWFWPEDDTSSDACRQSEHEIYPEADPGEVIGISCGGVVWTRYYAWLPPADDADSDDEFVVDAPTREEAEERVRAEQQRRADLAKGEPA